MEPQTKPNFSSEDVVSRETTWEHEFDQALQKIASVAEDLFTLHIIKQFMDQHQCTTEELVTFLSKDGRDQKYFFFIGLYLRSRTTIHKNRYA